MKKLIILLIIFFLNTNFTTLNAQAMLWGVTSAGGNGAGTIFSIKPDSQSLTNQFNLNFVAGAQAKANLVQASDGKLYGLTSSGGANGGGVIFQYDPVTNTYTDKIDLDSTIGDYNANSSYSYSLIQASDGDLYSITNAGGANGLGVIFQYDPVTNIYIDKFDLDSTIGFYPSGSLMQASDGKIYGMALTGSNLSNGVIFQYDPATNICVDKVNLVYDNFVGSLIQASDGKLYGYESVFIFQYDPVTSTYTRKIELDTINGLGIPDWYGSLMQANDGKLYGMDGSIFQYDPIANTCIKKVNVDSAFGGITYGSLMQASDGKLYGMSYTGGDNGGGVIFQYNLVTNTYTDKIDLSWTTGEGPIGSLIQASDGELYGMTSEGGGDGVGVIFQYNPITNIYTDKINLNTGTTGNIPGCSLILAKDGKLYGTTVSGGANGLGVIFQYDTLTNTYIDKIDLDTAIGAFPIGSLIQASDNNLYGMTSWGGAHNGGVIFQYNPITNSYVDKIDLDSTTGANPGANPIGSGSLMQASDGKLYGMTNGGGAHNGGVIFQYNPITNSYVDKIDLDSTTGANTGAIPGGANPIGSGSLMQASDGKLYGMTNGGGANYAGVIFQYDPIANTYTDKIDLNSTTGSFPDGSLMQASDGKLYGMTSQGGAKDSGVIFQYDPMTNIYLKKIDLSSIIGALPCGSLIQASDGKLYGMTGTGGAFNDGVIFQYNQVTNTYTKLLDFNGTNGKYPYGSLMEATQLAAITATANPDTTVCAGSEVQLVASGGTTYQWAPSTGLSDSVVANPILIPLATTTYTVTVSSGGLSGTATTTITVLPAPPVPSITQSHDTLFCSYNSAYISYQWYADSSLLSGKTELFLVITQNGNYNVEVTNQNGCEIAVGTNVAILDVQNNFNADDISFYPNPVSTQITIHSPQLTIKYLELYNVLGQNVLSTSPSQLGNGAATIDVSGFPAGLYFVKAVSEEKTWMGKFVKN